uniref:Putative ovule protein n=1 Tax=Solanum chacoense TaxID=4108 RepID=A0A0V0GFT1_SOLCH
MVLESNSSQYTIYRYWAPILNSPHTRCSVLGVRLGVKSHVNAMRELWTPHTDLSNSTLIS